MAEHQESATNVSVRGAANPGRDVQRVGTAKYLGEDVSNIYGPVWAVLGNLGVWHAVPL